MRNRFLVYGIFISLGLHLIFFSNIKLDIMKEKPLDIQLVKIPPELNKNDLIPKKENDLIPKKENDLIPKKNLNNLSKIKEEPEIYCELCKPIKEIIVPNADLKYGEAIKKITMTYKVLHDLGPNKSAMSNVKPFGADSKSIGNRRKKLISVAGDLRISYEANKKKYIINYEANAEGISSIFFSKPLLQKSIGLISSLGLKPEYYLYSYGGKKKSEAYFDWDSQTLTINRINTTNKYALINDAQDQLSFMFQFMFLNPLNRMQIPITNAKVFKIYNYHYIDEVKLDTKIGNLDVLHVAKFNYQDPERIDLWLAKKYGYLPVQISITQENLSKIIQKIENLTIKKSNESDNN